MPGARGRLVWVGSDAALRQCASVDYTSRTGAVFSCDCCQLRLDPLTGFPLSDFALIAISEFLSFICFLRSMAVAYRGKLLSYFGDNSNVAHWINHRQPRNRVARYLVRILNRLVAGYNFTVFDCFISPTNKKLCDGLSRLTSDDTAKQFENWGLTFTDVSPAFKWFLAERLSNLSLILPTDFPGRIRVVIQFVEKRMVRSTHECVKSKTQFVFFGDGPNWRLQPRVHMESHGLPAVFPPWPSECGDAVRDVFARKLPQLLFAFSRRHA